MIFSWLGENRKDSRYRSGCGAAAAAAAAATAATAAAAHQTLASMPRFSSSSEGWKNHLLGTTLNSPVDLRLMELFLSSRGREKNFHLFVSGELARSASLRKATPSRSRRREEEEGAAAGEGKIGVFPLDALHFLVVSAASARETPDAARSHSCPSRTFPLINGRCRQLNDSLSRRAFIQLPPKCTFALA